MLKDVEENKVAPTTLRATGLWWIWLSMVAVVLDQATKLWVIDSIEYGVHIKIMSLLDFTHIHNHGAAFSFLSTAGGWQRWLLTGIAIVISGMLLWWMKSTPKSNKVLGMSYSLILGGAIGNLYDRVMYGYVEDFIYFYYQKWDFPAFNIADSAITLGAALLIFDAIMAKPDKEVANDSK